ncbi:hypothetical protein [Thalassotalea euphylliae]|uniref:Uncharacterized protein n=1 Tax=Thalassotalea euphylliae TaxID=1655234 RepID=A0A3E0UDX8_9GAMM|nr:hypothetical protein [Thalassotalea euphylliae]REL35198.1 hypothetical protein DXX92_07400 [Thalassotalea euphylliae]
MGNSELFQFFIFLSAIAIFTKSKSAKSLGNICNEAKVSYIYLTKQLQHAEIKKPLWRHVSSKSAASLQTQNIDWLQLPISDDDAPNEDFD